MPLMRQQVRRVGVLVVLAVFLGAAGCSGRPAVYRVHGRITFEGKPMQGGGAIVFVPTGASPGREAGGEIAADGTFQLTTHSAGDGATVGDFRVAILQAADKDPDPSQPKPTPGVAPADRIPAAYADHQKSPLTAKVEAKGLNEINFDLQRFPAAEPVNRGARGDPRAKDEFAWLKP